jgi:hypothetical protein
VLRSIFRRSEKAFFTCKQKSGATRFSNRIHRMLLPDTAAGRTACASWRKHSNSISKASRLQLNNTALYTTASPPGACTYSACCAALAPFLSRRTWPHTMSGDCNQGLTVLTKPRSPGTCMRCAGGSSLKVTRAPSTPGTGKYFSLGILQGAHSTARQVTGQGQHKVSTRSAQGQHKGKRVMAPSQHTHAACKCCIMACSM